MGLYVSFLHLFLVAVNISAGQGFVSYMCSKDPQSRPSPFAKPTRQSLSSRSRQYPKLGRSRNPSIIKKEINISLKAIVIQFLATGQFYSVYRGWGTKPVDRHLSHVFILRGEGDSGVGGFAHQGGLRRVNPRSNSVPTRMLVPG